MKYWNRILAAVLAALLLCAMLPVGMLAETDVELETDDLEIVLDDGAAVDEALEPDGIGELDDLDVNDLLTDDSIPEYTAAEEATSATESNASNPEDFVIENGRLVRYVGPGGDVVIPDGVVSIADYVFYDIDYILSMSPRQSSPPSSIEP